MRDLDLTTLRLFVTVCETGSIARAGERAHIVGSAISKRLAQLEQTVGTSLLVRRNRGVVPTAAGQSLLQHARAILYSAACIERDMQAYAAGVQGQVRVLASASAMGFLAQDVASFLQQPAHRNIQVDLEERIGPEVVRGVRDGTASLGICWDITDAGELECRSYRHDQLCVVVPSGHALVGRDEVCLEQTLDFEHVSLPVTSAVQVLVQREAARLGRSLSYRVFVTNFEAALRVVRAELTIAIVPREVAELHAHAGGLHVIPLAEPWARRRFIVCHREGEALSTAAHLLADHLASCADD